MLLPNFLTQSEKSRRKKGLSKTMSRSVYFAGKNHFGFMPDDESIMSRPDINLKNGCPLTVPEYFEIYERYLKKPLRGQSIKQMECTATACYLLTTEMSQVFFIGHRIRRDLELSDVVLLTNTGTTTPELISGESSSGDNSGEVTNVTRLGHIRGSIGSSAI